MQDVLLIDGNSVGFAAHSSNKLHTGDQETQAVFGILRTIRSLLDEFRNTKPIVFWDGASWRKQMDTSYKADRDDDPKQSVEREAYRRQRPIIGRALACLSVTQIVTANMEADDMIALTVANRISTNKPGLATVVSGDRDLLQLVQQGVDWHNPIHLPGGRIPKLRHVNHMSFAESVGYETPEQFVQGKALIGDASDNLKGVTGIGATTAPLILNHWGSVSKAVMELRKGGEAAVPPHLSRFRKKLLNFATSNEEVARYAHNIRMMSLDAKHMPDPVGLNILQMPYSEAKFLRICEDLAFLSILRNHESWTLPFRKVALVEEAA